MNKIIKGPEVEKQGEEEEEKNKGKEKQEDVVHIEKVVNQGNHEEEIKEQ